MNRSLLCTRGSRAQRTHELRIGPRDSVMQNRFHTPLNSLHLPGIHMPLHRSLSLSPTMSYQLQRPPWPEVATQRRDDLQPGTDDLRTIRSVETVPSKSALALLGAQARPTPVLETRSRLPAVPTEAADWPEAGSRTVRAHAGSTQALPTSVRRNTAMVEGSAPAGSGPVEIDQDNSIATQLEPSELLEGLDTRLRELTSQLTARIDDQVARMQFRNALFGP